jgi:hypothetical protein
MSNESTYKNLPKEEKEKAVRKEMLPFFLYAAIPLIITITIALVFGPRLV